MVCMRCIISGRVQGVWFRDSTRQKATHLNITGHAINLPNGKVEVIACGEQQHIEALREWLWHGPKLAVVSDVKCSALPDQAFTSFTIG